MLGIILLSQVGTLGVNLSLLAAETTSETTSENTSDLANDEASEATSEETSEATSEETSEATSEETSEATSEESAVTSEETVKIASDNIDATIVIDDNGATEEQQVATPQTLLTTAELAEDENQTSYKNELRIDGNSGESKLTIEPTTSANRSLNVDTPIYYVLNSEGEIVSGSTKQPRSYTGNLITVIDGTIVNSDSAIIRTSGGYEESFYIYPTMDDLAAKTNGVPFSGGGFDGTFLETVEVDGVYYDHVKISGYEGYTEAGNIQIIPAELRSAQSYYTVEDGDWVYYSALDALNSTEYDRIVVDEAPSDAVIGTKYYTDDDSDFYTDSILTDKTAIDVRVSYNSYFMNLPFRSASSYTATDFKNYLKYKGKTSSQYYNATSSFIDAQSLESINSLMLFAFANHESAYGTSKYSLKCNNFFGRGAYDSNPDNACIQFGYKTPRDGILAQTLFLQNQYFDVFDFRYGGMHAGNKASGINAVYASDSDWGKKLSQHAYMIDQYEGGKEENKYAILKVTGDHYVYNDSALNDRINSLAYGSTTSKNYYNIDQVAGTSNSVNVVALRQTSGTVEIYPPMAVKQSSSTSCSYSDSQKGSYPNYGGRSSVSVPVNTANYSCDYGSFTNAKKWISRTNTTVINNKTVPGVTKNIYVYFPDGKVEYKYVVDSLSSEIKYAYRYDESGNIINKYLYQDGTIYGKNHGQKVSTRYTLKNDKVTLAVSYNSNHVAKYYYTYYSNATLSNAAYNIKYRYNMNTSTNYITNMYAYPNDQSRKATRIYEYKSKTTYSNRSGRTLYKYKVQKGTNIIVQAERFASNGNVDKIYTYKDNIRWGDTSGDKFLYVYWLKGSNLEIDYAIKYNKNQPIIKYTYYSGTIYGQNHGSKIKSKYYY